MKYIIEFDDTPGYGVDGDKYYKIKNKEWLWVRERDLNDFEMLVSCKDCANYMWDFDRGDQQHYCPVMDLFATPDDYCSGAEYDSHNNIGE